MNPPIVLLLTRPNNQRTISITAIVHNIVRSSPQPPLVGFLTRPHHASLLLITAYPLGSMSCYGV